MAATLTAPEPQAEAIDQETVAELLARLGGVPAERVLMRPTPGTATEADAIESGSRYGRLCELVDGTLVEKPVGMFESIVASVINRLLGNFVAAGRLGVIAGEQGMMRVVPGQLRMADVSFTSWARLPADYTTNPAPRVSPDLAVEVLSESNTATEMARKRAEYFRGGTKLVWIVDPVGRTFSAYRPGQAEPTVHGVGDVIDGGEALPGFTLDIADVFEQAARPVQP